MINETIDDTSHTHIHTCTHTYTRAQTHTLTRKVLFNLHTNKFITQSFWVISKKVINVYTFKEISVLL